MTEVQQSSNGQVIARAAQILAALEAASEGRTVSELARTTGLPRTTVHRLASALLNQIEVDARESGVCQLRTEASQLSRPLLERRGWLVEAPETILIGGVPFERYRMVKLLRQVQS